MTKLSAKKNNLKKMELGYSSIYDRLYYLRDSSSRNSFLTHKTILRSDQKPLINLCSSCPNLVDLDLSYNELESIPTFELPALKNLQLQHNKLASMTTSSRTLYLLNVFLEILFSPSCTFPAFSVEFYSRLISRFLIAFCHNYHFTGWMSVSSNIETLNLQSNKIEAVPDELFKCVKITSLDLSHNRLKTLQEAIGKLSSLTFLDLSRNQLTSLPSQVGDLSKLTSVLPSIRLSFPQPPSF